jgi:hypothetical protein
METEQIVKQCNFGCNCRNIGNGCKFAHFEVCMRYCADGCNWTPKPNRPCKGGEHPVKVAEGVFQLASGVKLRYVGFPAKDVKNAVNGNSAVGERKDFKPVVQGAQSKGAVQQLDEVRYNAAISACLAEVPNFQPLATQERLLKKQKDQLLEMLAENTARQSKIDKLKLMCENYEAILANVETASQPDSNA